MNAIKWIPLISATLLGIGAAWPSYADSSATFRVSVHLTAKDQELRDEVESYLDRELRGLHDVEITDTNPSYQIDVMAMPADSKAGVRSGNAISIVVFETGVDWGWALSKRIPPIVRKKVAHTLSTAGMIADHVLLIGSSDDLEEQMSQFVADFDTQILQPARDSMQRTREPRHAAQ